MAAWRRFFLRLFSHALRPASAERDLAREIDAHLALLEDGFRERGMSEAEARRSARLTLGGADQTKEQHRDARSVLPVAIAEEAHEEIEVGSVRCHNAHDSCAWRELFQARLGSGQADQRVCERVH